MPVDILEGLSDEMALEMARNLEFKDSVLATAAEQIRSLYNLFISVDATQVEINPFGETPDGRGNWDNRRMLTPSNNFSDML